MAGRNNDENDLDKPFLIESRMKILRPVFDGDFVNVQLDENSTRKVKI